MYLQYDFYLISVWFLSATILQTMRNDGNVLVAVDTAGRMLELAQLLVRNKLKSEWYMHLQGTFMFIYVKQTRVWHNCLVYTHVHSFSNWMHPKIKRNWRKLYMYLKNSNCINCFWNFKRGNKSLVTNCYIYGISLMSLSNTEMHSTIETLISRQSLTLVGPDVEECRVRPLSLLSRPAQQCQLQCGRICKISGNTWSYFIFHFYLFVDYI